MKTSPQIKSILSSIGLDTKEQAIYLASLELGETLQLPLAKKVCMKRTSLRELLPGLLERGILQEVVHGKRKYLIARDPRDLVYLLEQKAEQARVLLPQLLAIQNIRPEKPEVRFFEGIAGIKQVYEETLNIGQPIYTFLDVSQIDPEIENWLVNDYVPSRETKSVPAYNLVNDSPKVKEIMPLTGKRENRIVPRDKFPFSMDVLVFGDYVAFDHYQKHQEPSVVLIKSQAAANTMRSIHKALWENLI